MKVKLAFQLKINSSMYSKFYNTESDSNFRVESNFTLCIGIRKLIQESSSLRSLSSEVLSRATKSSSSQYEGIQLKKHEIRSLMNAWKLEPEDLVPEDYLRLLKYR